MDEEMKIPQVCRINVTFPVESDEQAIGYKKALSETLSTIPNARVDFQLISVPDKFKPPVKDDNRESSVT